MILKCTAAHLTCLLILSSRALLVTVGNCGRVFWWQLGSILHVR